MTGVQTCALPIFLKYRYTIFLLQTKKPSSVNIGLESTLSPTPVIVPPELPTETPFSVGLNDSDQPVPAKLKYRTRPCGRFNPEEPESSKIDDAATLFVSSHSTSK